MVFLRVFLFFHCWLSPIIEQFNNKTNVSHSVREYRLEWKLNLNMNRLSICKRRIKIIIIWINCYCVVALFLFCWLFASCIDDENIKCIHTTITNRFSANSYSFYVDCLLYLWGLNSICVCKCLNDLSMWISLNFGLVANSRKKKGFFFSHLFSWKADILYSLFVIEQLVDHLLEQNLWRNQERFKWNYDLFFLYFPLKLYRLLFTVLPRSLMMIFVSSKKKCFFPDNRRCVEKEMWIPKTLRIL